jgi:hypothetical protein
LESSNSAVAGIQASLQRLLLMLFLHVVFAAAVDPAVTEVLQSLQSLLLLVFLLRLTSLLFQAVMLLVAFLLLLGSC